MASSVFTVNGYDPTGGIAVSASSTITCALVSTTGVNIVAWSFIGSHSSSESYPTITTSDAKGTAMTFDTIAGAQSWILQCVVNGSYDENRDYDSTLTRTALIGVNTGDGYLLFASNETAERSATHGWTEQMNDHLNACAYGTGAHHAAHEDGGADEISGDDLAIAASPTNYTPADGTLAGHLSGIDDKLEPVQEVITVAKAGGDYTDIQNAIDSITDAATGKRYVVKLAAGLWQPSASIVLQDYVSLVGESRHDCVIEYGSDSGAIQMANESMLSDVMIKSSSTASNWGIIVNNKTGVQIRHTDILAPMGSGQVAQGIHAYGSSWATLFISDCIINYVGTTGWGVLIEGDATTPQNSDAHIERCFVDSYYATSGGSVKVKDCSALLIDGGKYRTTATGTTLLTEATGTPPGATVDVGILGGVLFLAPGVGNSHVVDVGAYTSLHHWDAYCQAIRQNATTSWVQRYPNNGHALKMPSSTDFAWVNQGSSTITVNPDGSWVLMQPKRGAGVSISIREIASLTPPYDWIGRVWPTHSSKADICSGLCWRESGTGEIVAVMYQIGYLAIGKYDDTVTFNSWYFSQPWPIAGPVWLRLRDDGTNREVYVSPDGWNWQGIHTVGRTDFLTANKVGVFVNADNAGAPQLDAQLLIDHLAITSG